jgi:hypothetical protein
MTAADKMLTGRSILLEYCIRADSPILLYHMPNE